MGNVSGWEYRDSYYANNAMLSEVSRHGIKRLILHWTIPHPSLKLTVRNLLLRNAYDKKARLALIGMAKNVTCLTLVANPDKLIERVRLREKRVKELRAEGRDSQIKYRQKLGYVKALIATYNEIERVVPMYDRWFAFCEQMCVTQHYLVDVNADPFLTSLSSWRDFVTRWEMPTAG